MRTRLIVTAVLILSAASFVRAGVVKHEAHDVKAVAKTGVKAGKHVGRDVTHVVKSVLRAVW
jgi:hypothetical protein